MADAVPYLYGTESTTGGVAWRTSNRNPIDIGANSLLGFTDLEGSTLFIDGGMSLYPEFRGNG